MNDLMVLEAPEVFAFIEHEVACPFCGHNMLSIVEDTTECFYMCGSCNNSWSVLGEAA